MTTVQQTTAKPKRRVSPWWALLLIPVGLAMLPLTGLVRPPNAAGTQPLETATVSQTTFRVSVSGSGTLRAISTFDVKPQVSGTVLTLPTEGQRVSKGQLLAHLDPSTLQLSAESDQLALKKAQTQLASARASQANSRGNQQQTIASAQANFRNAQVDARNAADNLGNQRLVYTAGGISAQEFQNAQNSLDKANAALSSARIALQTAQQAVELNADSNAQDLKNLQLAADQAQVQLQTAQADLGKTKLYAPVSGVVSNVVSQIGDPASNLLALFTVLDDSATELPVQVDETQIGKVRVGQAAAVKIEALAGQEFVGTVTRISPKADVVQNIAVFSVTVALPNADHTLRPGMTGDAEIISRAYPNSLTVPKRALQGTPPTVNVLDSATQKQTTRSVQTGPDDGLNIVITGGLKAGELVVLPVRAIAPQGGGGLLP